MKLFLLYIALVLSLITCSINTFPSQSNNLPPIIHGITITPPQPTIKQVVTLKAFATDADDDELLYKWSVSGGALTNNTRGNPIYWSTPYSFGNYIITCLVSDGTEITTKSIGVNIQDDSNLPLE